MIVLWLLHQDVKPEKIRRLLLLYILERLSVSPEAFGKGQCSQGDLVTRAVAVRVYKKTGASKAVRKDLLWLKRNRFAYEEKGFWYITKQGREELGRLEEAVAYRSKALHDLLAQDSVEFHRVRRASLTNLLNNLLKLFR